MAPSCQPAPTYSAPTGGAWRTAAPRTPRVAARLAVPGGAGALAPSPRAAVTRPTAVRRTARSGAASAPPRAPATLRVESDPTRRGGHGDGLGRAARTGCSTGCPRMLGADDDPTGFEPPHQLIADAWRRHPHWRLGATGLVMESLVPTIIEQKVTGQEAFAAFRAAGAPLRRARAGTAERAGAGRAAVGAAVPRAAAGDPVVGVAAAARRRRRGRGRSSTRPGWRRRWSGPAGRRRPSSTAGCARCPGIGVWTSAEVRFRALGDADAVSFGDYHIAEERRLGADRRAGRRRGSGRAARAVRRPPPPGPAPGRARRAARARDAGRGWRRDPPAGLTSAAPPPELESVLVRRDRPIRRHVRGRDRRPSSAPPTSSRSPR